MNFKDARFTISCCCFFSWNFLAPTMEKPKWWTLNPSRKKNIYRPSKKRAQHKFGRIPLDFSYQRGPDFINHLSIGKKWPPKKIMGQQKSTFFDGQVERLCLWAARWGQGGCGGIRRRELITAARKLTLEVTHPVETKSHLWLKMQKPTVVLGDLLGILLPSCMGLFYKPL